ncbi:hypothetical protein V7266_06145 [Neobacillus drentensis]|uniref:hypothetical protein n=1 Tax=Neobacillus drentensis TaxID=220684 RepID=UPI002FFD83FE
MADKRENEKELNMQPEKTEILETESNEEEKVKASVKKESKEQLSSLELLWSLAFGELDEWGKRAENRDAVFLNAAKQYAEGVQRNHGNLIEIGSQFHQEFSSWEKTAREEFLMSTTSLQHFFPFKSYEDINKQIDQLQEKTLNILAAPYTRIVNTLSVDKYVEIIEQYITLRRRGREQYIKTVKQAGNLIYENQKGFVNLFTRQIKSFMFPMSKYLEKP